MSRGLSAYLDALRFSAAFVVLLSHFAYPRFSGGRWLWLRELNLGSDAVVVFFVLSGLVISHATHSKPGGAGQFAFDRLTRLVSVALPALLLGFALDRMGARIDPQLYQGWMYNPLPLAEQLLRGLTFSNEWSGMAVRLGTNGPYWSLSYEAAYYAIFGIAIYTQGLRRVVLLALGCSIAGLNILLLLPAWLIGVAVHRATLHLSRLPRSAALWLAAVPVAAYAGALAVDLPQYLRLPIMQYQAGLRFSDEFIWNTLLAGLVALHLLGMARLLSGGQGFRNTAQIRWLAGGSFSLYLVHYPVLQALAALGLASSSLTGDALLIGSTVAACYGFAHLSERRLPAFRRGIRWLVSSAAGHLAPARELHRKP